LRGCGGVSACSNRADERRRVDECGRDRPRRVDAIGIDINRRGVKSRIVLVFTPCTSKMMPSKIPSTAAREMLTRHRAPSRIFDKCFLSSTIIVIIRIFVPAHTPTPSSSRKSAWGGGKRRARSVGVRMSECPPSRPCVRRVSRSRDATPSARDRARRSFVVARPHESSWCVRGEARDRSRAMARTRDRARDRAASVAARRRAEARKRDDGIGFSCARWPTTTTTTTAPATRASGRRWTIRTVVDVRVAHRASMGRERRWR